MYSDHGKGDSITAVATTKDNNFILTADNVGNLKCWDFTNFVFKQDFTTEKIKVKWFIQAHRNIINAL